MPSNADNLIPELKDWNDGCGIDMRGYLSCMGNYELAIAFTDFFWPTFVEHDGCIFRNKPDLKNYEQWKQKFKGDKTGIESLMNHLHILDVFPNVEQPPSREQLVYLGQQLKEMWALKINKDFPNTNVIFEFTDNCGDDLLEYVITFFQQRPESDLSHK